jgi:hypothetical protein
MGHPLDATSPTTGDRTMTRDELAEKLAQRAVADDMLAVSVSTYFLALADAAIAALAPKLTWTEWGPNLSDQYVSCEAKIGKIPVAVMCRYRSHTTGSVIGLSSLTTENTPEAIAALRAEIERRVREAMS